MQNLGAVSDGLGLYFKDLYPNYAGTDTSNNVTPEADDQDALGEDVKTAETVSVTESSGRNILLALALLVGLVIFFGAGK